LRNLSAAAALLSLPCLHFALAASAAEASRKYSKKVVDLVERSLVIDMLGPLKIDFRPEAYSEPLTEQEAAMFRSSWITAFHNSEGVGGAGAYDEALQFIAAWSGFREPTTVEDVVDHIDHVVKLVGIEHVGIGTDSDLQGYDHMPPDQYEKLKAAYKSTYAFRDKLDTDGFNHPRKIYDLTDALVRRGYSEGNIQAVLGGNFRRLLGESWSQHHDAEKKS